mmetsp:Transcript_15755/g.22404  ORF Transcript_15755/g.22404 Transcript_15755/m.22404 type:complete len:292 (-) Transcript_15755:90-965(-)
MVDEETPLNRGSNSLGKISFVMNIERIRFFGLMGVVALLFVGAFTSHYAVVYPPKEDPSSFWDKLFHGAPSDFEASQTFIFKLFHFNHTCSVLDFNPSKTLSALVIMLHTIPINFFVICHYLRITSHTEPKFVNLTKFTKVATPIQFIFFTFFYMVFVNSPDGEFGTDEGMRKFALHYAFYAFWQFGMLLMAIQQCWYIHLKEMIPFPWVTPKMMWIYLKFMVVLFVIYTWFCVSFIVDRPAWDTNGGFGRFFAITIMYTWDVVAVVIPSIFAWYESSDGADTKFTFEELQ